MSEIFLNDNLKSKIDDEVFEIFINHFADHLNISKELIKRSIKENKKICNIIQ